MARKAKTDRELMPQRVRLSKVKSVEADFTANAEVSVAKLEENINESEAILSEYNQMLAAADAKGNDYDASVRKGMDLSERLLEAIGLKYGKDSNEYEMAGGKRKSERKKPVRKQTPTP